MADATVNRSRDRHAQVNFRMTPENRERLRALAADAGLSVQDYLHQLVFQEPVTPKRLGRPFKHERDVPHPGVDHSLGLAM